MNAAVRRLDGRSRGEIVRHLQQLGHVDRWLRFGATIDDAGIERYVGAIDFPGGWVFGVFGAGATLRGVAHLEVPARGDTALLGLSVVHSCRGQGLGTALLAAAGRQAERLGLNSLHIRSLAENRVMVHLARKVGMTLVRPVQPEAYIALGTNRARAAVRTLPATNSC